jgi:protocatechuate 4,5-dioxygenase alpha chain
MPHVAHDYDDIPGTFIFDAEKSRRGYHLNMFCMSLMKEENRRAFKADEAQYLKRFPMTDEQREAILRREWNRMLELGGNIYFTAKLGATDGLSFQQVAAIMTGSTQQDYAAMMLGGGRSVEGNRSKSKPGGPPPLPPPRAGEGRVGGKPRSKKAGKKRG